LEFVSGLPRLSVHDQGPPGMGTVSRCVSDTDCRSRCGHQTAPRRGRPSQASCRRSRHLAEPRDSHKRGEPWAAAVRIRPRARSLVLGGCQGWLGDPWHPQCGTGQYHRHGRAVKSPRPFVPAPCVSAHRKGTCGGPKRALRRAALLWGLSGAASRKGLSRKAETSIPLSRHRTERRAAGERRLSP
jgi:hypothetical protein